MRDQKSELDTIYCVRCQRAVVLSNGRFLRPVIVLCHDCKERTKWTPDRKTLDKRRSEDDIS